jgi:hypothetical protein
MGEITCLESEKEKKKQFLKLKANYKIYISLIKLVVWLQSEMDELNNVEKQNLTASAYWNTWQAIRTTRKCYLHLYGYFHSIMTIVFYLSFVNFISSIDVKLTEIINASVIQHNILI